MSSLPASIKRIVLKTNEKRWRHHFSHCKSMGAFCCQSFDPICPKTFCNLFPTPVMLHIKFDPDWPIGFRDVQIQNCEIFITQGASNSKMCGLIRPKTELDQAFMLVLVISNIDDDSIKNERASMETAVSHYKSMGNFLVAQGQLTP